MREVTSDYRGSTLGLWCCCWLLTPRILATSHVLPCLEQQTPLYHLGSGFAPMSVFYIALGNVILNYSFASHLVGRIRRLAELRSSLNTQLPSEWHNAARDHLWTILLPTHTHRPPPHVPVDQPLRVTLRKTQLAQVPLVMHTLA